MPISNNYHLLTEKQDKEVINIFTTDCQCPLSTYQKIVIIENVIVQFTK